MPRTLQQTRGGAAHAAAPLRRVAVAMPIAALVTLALAGPVGAQGLRPGTLLIYYGYPTSINSTFSVPAAAAQFGQYDYVVWGDGLQNLTHPDHANAVAILAHPATASTRVCGYVDLGVSTQNLPMAEAQARIASWAAMGVDGVLLDDFGYDYGTSRARQNQAVQFAHTLGLAVIANAFRPEDAFGRDLDPLYNPARTATSLGASDFYLYESHGVRLGDYEDDAAWKAKSDAIESYHWSLGFHVLSITTTATDGPSGYDASRFFYAWHAALLCGHEATGWGEYGFSASGASNGQAPFRARPTLDPGSAFIGPVVHEDPLHTRRTDTGRVVLNTAVHGYAFIPGTADAPVPSATALRLSLTPNPARAGTRVDFVLEHPGTARLTVFDLSGRRVATIATGELGGGPHHRWWAGVDDAGGRVAAGSYFVVLEAGGRRSVERLVVAR